MVLHIDKPAQSGLGYLAEALGSGIGQGLQEGVDNYFKQKKSQSDLIGAFDKVGKSLYDRSGKAYDEPTRRKIFDNAKQFVAKGVDPTEASILAWDEFLKPKQGQPGQEGQSGNALETLKGGLAKGFRPVVEKYADLPFNLLKGLGGLGRQGIAKLAGLNPEEIAAREQKFASDIAAGEKATGVINPLSGKGFTELYDELTGGRGVPQNAVERIVSGYPFGPAGIGAEYFKETARSAGLPEWAQELAALAGFPAGAIGGAKLTKAIPQAAKTIKDQIAKIPGFKKTVQDAAKAAGVSEEKIIEEATKSLANRGIKVETAAQGDANALNALQKEVKATAEKFKGAEKFNKKKAEKVREETGKKLAESPLEQYYAPKKEVKSRPETIAKEAERVKPLDARVKQIDRSLKDLNYSLSEGKAALRKAEGAEAERIEAKIQNDEIQKRKLLNELEAKKFEIKHKRAPATHEEIKQQIEKSFAELREGIKDPTAAKVVKVRDQLAKDRKAIDQAEKLVERGEIPGPEVYDEFIKINEQYNKAYGDLIKELNEFIHTKKGGKAYADRVTNAEKLRDLVKELKQHSDAKIVNHIDKRKAMRTLNKPSGAFYRNMLKDLRNDVNHFQQSFFKWNKIAGEGEKKVGEAAKKGLEAASNTKEASKVAEAAAKNPTAENIGKIAEASGVPNETISQYIQRLRGKAKDVGKKIENGTASVADQTSLTRDLLKAYNKMHPIKRSLTGGLIIGTLQGLSEEYFGIKPSSTVLALGTTAVIPGGIRTRAGTGAIAGMVSAAIRNLFNEAEAKKLRKLRNTPEFNKYRESLAKRYSEDRANKIVKKAIE